VQGRRSAAYAPAYRVTTPGGAGLRERSGRPGGPRDAARTGTAGPPRRSGGGVESRNGMRSTVCSQPPGRAPHAPRTAALDGRALRFSQPGPAKSSLARTSGDGGVRGRARPAAAASPGFGGGGGWSAATLPAGATNASSALPLPGASGVRCRTRALQQGAPPGPHRGDQGFAGTVRERENPRSRRARMRSRRGQLLEKPVRPGYP